MLKKVWMLLLVLFVAFSFAACDDGGDDEGDSAVDLGPSAIDDLEKGEATQEQANDMANSIMSSITNVVTEANGAVRTESETDEQTVDWKSDDGTVEVTGTMQSQGEYTLTITFKDYSDGTVMLNGITEYIVVSNSTSDTVSTTMDYSGDFKVGFANKRYDYSWDIKITMTMDSGYNFDYDVNGTVTCNGETYDFIYAAATR